MRKKKRKEREGRGRKGGNAERGKEKQTKLKMIMSKTLALSNKLWIVSQCRIRTVTDQLSTNRFRVRRHDRTADDNVLPIYASIIDLSEYCVQLSHE